jgi:hypothetical protein
MAHAILSQNFMGRYNSQWQLKLVEGENAFIGKIYLVVLFKWVKSMRYPASTNGIDFGRLSRCTGVDIVDILQEA